LKDREEKTKMAMMMSKTQRMGMKKRKMKAKESCIIQTMNHIRIDWAMVIALESSHRPIIIRKWQYQ
jgi:hypothetical protein